jgi:hypothetical protein
MTTSQDPPIGNENWTLPEGMRRRSGQPILAIDSNGRTRFYAMGLIFNGYMISDPARERALRDAMKRFNIVDTAVQATMIFPLIISTRWLFGPLIDRGLAALTVSLAICAIARTLTRSWCFDDLVAGLERVGPLDVAGARKGRVVLVLACIAYALFVAWRIFHAINANPY